MRAGLHRLPLGSWGTVYGRGEGVLLAHLNTNRSTNTQPPLRNQVSVPQ